MIGVEPPARNSFVGGIQLGAYRLLHRIGDGGMGEVWLAEHAMLGRRAAIKVLRRELTANPDMVTRFFNEARAATAISDAGIVQIFDFGHHVDGSAYIVMELLEGEALDERLKRCRMLPIGDALRIIRQVASSLGAAHARGIVHRDLKPENIFLVRDAEVIGGERAKILDFGIAKLIGDATMKTNTSVMMGTPMYMSPEQCRGAGQVDMRADIYALGCVLFALVSGQPPFVAEGAGELIAMHLREAAPRLSSRARGVPHGLDELVLRCLAKDPNERFRSGGELATAIGALIATLPPVGPPSAQIAAPPSTPAHTTLTTAVGTSIPPRPAPARRAVVIVTSALVVTCAAIAWVATHRAQETAAPPAAPPPVVVVTPAPPTVVPIVPEPPPKPIVPEPPPKPEPPKAIDLRADVATRMKGVLAGFVRWSKGHAGAACPDLSALGTDTVDPWGHALRLTCTEQPADQMIGVLSAGPDGDFGTADDILSWRLEQDVTDIVHGPHWVVPPVAAATHPTPPATKPVVHPPAAPSPIVDPFATAPKHKPPAPPPPPVLLDADGLPISR